jgi:hypothetical protein
MVRLRPPGAGQLRAHRHIGSAQMQQPKLLMRAGRLSMRGRRHPRDRDGHRQARGSRSLGRKNNLSSAPSSADHQRPAPGLPSTGTPEDPSVLMVFRCFGRRAQEGADGASVGLGTGRERQVASRRRNERPAGQVSKHEAIPRDSRAKAPLLSPASTL